MSLDNVKEAYMYVGNPGCGKSTMANCRAQELLFGSGTSFGGGFTKDLDIKTKGDIGYVDTPGLADAKLRAQAAAAISKALKHGGMFKVIFCCKQDSGRVRPADIATIKMVLEACDEITANNFGIIVNMCSNKIMKKIAVEENRTTFSTVLQEELPRKTTFVLFLEVDPDLEDEGNAVVPVSKLKNYGAFLDQLPLVSITKGRAKDVKADEFEKLNAAMEEKNAQIKELMERADRRDAAAMKQLEEMRREHQDQLAKIAAESGRSWNPIAELAGAVADTFVPGSASHVKRFVDGAVKSFLPF